MDQGKTEEEAAGMARSFEGHADFLADIKGRIQAAKVRATPSLSREVVRGYGPLCPPWTACGLSSRSMRGCHRCRTTVLPEPTEDVTRFRPAALD